MISEFIIITLICFHFTFSRDEMREESVVSNSFISKSRHVPMVQQKQNIVDSVRETDQGKRSIVNIRNIRHNRQKSRRNYGQNWRGKSPGYLATRAKITKPTRRRYWRKTTTTKMSTRTKIPSTPTLPTTSRMRETSTFETTAHSSMLSTSSTIRLTSKPSTFSSTTKLSTRTKIPKSPSTSTLPTTTRMEETSTFETTAHSSMLSTGTTSATSKPTTIQITMPSTVLVTSKTSTTPSNMLSTASTNKIDTSLLTTTEQTSTIALRTTDATTNFIPSGSSAIVTSATAIKSTPSTMSPTASTIQTVTSTSATTPSTATAASPTMTTERMTTNSACPDVPTPPNFGDPPPLAENDPNPDMCYLIDPTRHKCDLDLVPIFCIFSFQICDGIFDCQDMTDELNNEDSCGYGTTDPITCCTKPIPSSSDYTGDLTVFRDKIIEAHNYFRCIHGVDPLEYSLALENTSVSEVANFTSSPSSPEDKDGVSLINMLAFFNIDEISVYSTVHSWYKEKEFYDFDNPVSNSANSNFIQLIWNGTERVGCAFQTSTDIAACGSFFAIGCVFVACVYDPPDNEVDLSENVPKCMADSNFCDL